MRYFRDQFRSCTSFVVRLAVVRLAPGSAEEKPYCVESPGRAGLLDSHGWGCSAARHAAGALVNGSASQAAHLARRFERLLVLPEQRREPAFRALQALRELGQLRADPLRDRGPPGVADRLRGG
jgi:hypothetical protein